jgi:hypothetical protein
MDECQRCKEWQRLRLSDTCPSCDQAMIEEMEREQFEIEQHELERLEIENQMLDEDWSLRHEKEMSLAEAHWSGQ